MSYGEATIRARIKTVLETVSNIGQVHDYERWADDWNTLLTLFKSTISGTDQIRGWAITCEGWTQDLVGFGGFGDDAVLVSYSYRVRGWLGVDDSAETEKTMAALAGSAAAALEADATLQSKALDNPEPVVRSVRLEYRMFAGVLCHYAEIWIRAQEVV